MAGIYVHVPFCRAKCAYCDFYSIAAEKFMEPYSLAVGEEWKARRAELGGQGINTIYFGGGTPSSLPRQLFLNIARLFPLDRVEEFTIEVNPEDVNPASVSLWREAGVNRVSMGVQSLVDEELKAVGRRHSAAEALAAIECIRAGGIGNISCDLIYGLPGQTEESWLYSVRKLLSTGISHLSAYSLSYEEGTKLSKWLDEGRITPVDDDVACRMYDTLCACAAEAGFVHYEISNFALPGFESKHNSSYWDGLTPYLGLGPGAHSLDFQGVRRIVPPGLTRYIAKPAESAEIDTESELDRINDLIFVSLRTARGLDLNRLPEELRRRLLAEAQRFIEEGLLSISGDRLAIPEHHWLISDSIIRDLLLEED
ncbi:MAG: radical SAM family heme chaperone HemW [Bacteroidales bacterium]|nr:radical SAM family heme chaperone HemW [Bacteroidales bacterium]